MSHPWGPPIISAALREFGVFERDDAARDLLAGTLHVSGLTRADLQLLCAKCADAQSPPALLLTILRGPWPQDLRRARRAEEKAQGVKVAIAERDREWHRSMLTGRCYRYGIVDDNGAAGLSPDLARMEELVPLQDAWSMVCEDQIDPVHAAGRLHITVDELTIRARAFQDVLRTTAPGITANIDAKLAEWTPEAREERAKEAGVKLRRPSKLRVLANNPRAGEPPLLSLPGAAP